MSNSFTAEPGAMPYDIDATDDPPRDPICPECHRFHHTPACPYVQHVTQLSERDLRDQDQPVAVRKVKR